jgi:WD40 repeat protein
VLTIEDSFPDPRLSPPWYRFYDTNSGQEITSRFGTKKQRHQYVFSPDGRLVALAHDEGWHVRVCQVATGTVLAELSVGYKEADPAAFDPEGRRLAVISGRAVRVWDVRTGKSTSPEFLHESRVRAARFSPDGSQVLTVGHSRESGVWVWDYREGRPVAAHLCHNEPVEDAVFSPDGRLVLTTSLGSRRLWDLSPARQPRARLRRTRQEEHVQFSADGRRALTASGNRLRVWEVSTGRPLASLPPGVGKKNSNVPPTFSADGRRFLTCADQRIWVWDADTGRPVAGPLQTGYTIKKAALSPNGRHLFTASDNELRGLEYTPFLDSEAIRDLERPATREIRLWDLSAGNFRLLASETGTHKELSDSGPVRIAFHPEGRYVLIKDWRRRVRLWDASTGRPVPLPKPLREEDGWEQVLFRADGRCLLVPDTRRAYLWDVATGRVDTLPMPFSKGASRLEFSHDGRRLVTVRKGPRPGHSETRLWDVDTGQPLSPPVAHDFEAVVVRFSPDDRLVLAVGHTEGCVWEAATGQALLSFPVENSDKVQFTAGGRRVLSAGRSGDWWVWDVLPEDRPAKDLVALVEVLSGRRLDDGGRWTTLKEAEWQREWQRLRKKYPNEFAASADKGLSWHWQEAARAESREDWFAARFHLDRLVAAEPRQQGLYVRRVWVNAYLGDWARACDNVLQGAALQPTP